MRKITQHCNLGWKQHRDRLAPEPPAGWDLEGLVTPLPS